MSNHEKVLTVVIFLMAFFATLKNILQDMKIAEIDLRCRQVQGERR